MNKTTFANRMDSVDQVLLDRIGLTHLDMPDIDWWSIVENSDNVRQCVDEAFEQWIENGDLPEEAYDW